MMFTKRQQKIIDGELVPHLNYNDIIRIIMKALKTGDYFLAEDLYARYAYYMDVEIPQPTEEEIEEARRILYELTPANLR